MSSAAASARRIRIALEREGRAMALRRRVGTTNTYAEVAVQGAQRGYRPEELVGGIVQGDREVILGNAEIEQASWPGPPRRNDILVIDGSPATIQGVGTAKRGTVTLGHVCWVRG